MAIDIAVGVPPTHPMNTIMFYSRTLSLRLFTVFFSTLRRNREGAYIPSLGGWVVTKVEAAEPPMKPGGVGPWPPWGNVSAAGKTQTARPPCCTRQL